MKKGHPMIFVLYLILAFYLINNALVFISLPEFFVKIDKWILVISGLFLIFGGVNLLRLKRYSAY